MTTAMGATLLAITANDDSRVSPGVLGFIVVAILGLATWLLIRSMGKQLKKIDLPDDGVPTDPDGVERTVGTDGTDGTEGDGTDGAAGADPGPVSGVDERPGQ